MRTIEDVTVEMKGLSDALGTMLRQFYTKSVALEVILHRMQRRSIEKKKRKKEGKVDAHGKRVCVHGSRHGVKDGVKVGTRKQTKKGGGESGSGGGGSSGNVCKLCQVDAQGQRLVNVHWEVKQRLRELEYITGLFAGAVNGLVAVTSMGVEEAAVVENAI